MDGCQSKRVSDVEFIPPDRRVRVASITGRARLLWLAPEEAPPPRESRGGGEEALIWKRGCRVKMTYLVWSPGFTARLHLI